MCLFDFSNKKEDLYIRLLKYADSHEEGFNRQKMIDEMKLDQKEIAILFQHSFQEIFVPVLHLPEAEAYQGDDYLRKLSFDGKMKLIEYEAIQESKQGVRYAQIALVVSIITLLCSIIFSIIEISKDSPCHFFRFNTYWGCKMK